MLKRLAIAVWLMFVSAGILAAQNPRSDAPKQAIAKPDSSSKGKEQPQSQPGDHSPASAIAASPQPAAPTCDEACQQGRENLKVQRRLLWFTCGLVIVGFLQVCTMIWQAVVLKETRGDVHTQAGWMKTQTEHMGSQAETMESQTKILEESVKAAKISAEAADKNVELLINRERGRIFVEVSPFEIKNVVLNTQVVEFQVIYHGETVSFHENSSAEMKLTDSEQPPEPTVPSWFKSRGVFGVPAVIPAHSGPFNCATRLYRSFDQYELDRIGHNQSFVHFFGYIVYKDFMDRTHTTTFCYTWKPRPPAPSIDIERWQKSGPPEANRET